MLVALITLMRPKQWVKNVFVLAPLVFAGEFHHTDAVLRSLLATLFFCIASSATYIVNDLHDLEADRLHPKKSVSRPIAANQVSIAAAYALLALLYLVLLFGLLVSPGPILVIGLYLALNLAYTFALKDFPVIDLFCIASGFVLRVYAGAVSLDVPVSGWMFITTLCLALYLAAIKRKQELLLVGNHSRKVLNSYSGALVDRYANIAATSALIFYSMFVMSAKPELVISIPFVLFGIFRYWYVVEQKDMGESPTDALFFDRQLQLTIISWIALCAWAL